MPAPTDSPSRLFVEVTSRCNLHCPMCVKHSGSADPREGDMSPETFGALKPAFPHLQALILSGIGEPLMHAGLEGFIREAKEAMPAGSWVGFQTNGHLLDTARAMSLIDAGLDRIFLSVDSTSPEMFTSFRGGGNLNHVERALIALSEAKREHPDAALLLGAQFVLMRDNLRELPATVAWLAERGVTRLIVSHILPYDQSMADQPVFGVNTGPSVAFYDQWAERARQEDIDITQYFQVLWKYNKSHEDQRIVDFVKTMSDHALQADIPFHIGNLLSSDDLQQAESVFGRAQAVADDKGLSLVLPPLRPVSGRACLAVEQGGAFVTWDGRVSPCHFLWRSFSCYFFGNAKRVSPRFFGDLSSASLEEIWNSPAYRKFRAEVLECGYPHCPGCNVYPCDDIETTDFEYDCYGETIPCGDCLWSMGLLQCMGQEHDAR
ncbi:MAG: radical SAM/SPASM family putative metalloenzyme maturase [Desulfovibrio sp.]|nr:radical SAM/SPASM family putative metalloenzyme maturase [Desulfovibrio sp.]